MSNPKFLSGRVALVTGGASGMGRAIALALADAGANVAIGSLLQQDTAENDGAIAYLPSEEQLRQTHEAIVAQGVAVVSRNVDVCNVESVAHFIQAAREELGPIDILVNAAGMTVEHPMCGHPDALWHKVMDVNLNGPYRFIKACLPSMMERRWGRIINIASTAASVGAPTSAAYAASKAGLLGLTRCVALEGAAHGVSCNTISPGWVNTAFGRLWMSKMATQADLDAYQEQVRSANPQQRIIDPEEIAALTVFLCQDVAFGITMQDLVLSAGSLW